MKETINNELCGCIDELGFLKNLYRKGFTNDKCLSELIANSIDAKATKIIIKELENHIYFIENGRGMDNKGCNDMFAMNRSNHSQEKSIGVSGIGKVSLLMLSNKSLVQLYTRKIGEQYINITIPWGEIFEQGVYTNMIKKSPMNEEEILEFKKDREDMKVHGDYQGTTIKFIYNDQLQETISNNFKNPEELKSKNIIINPLNKQGVVFGHFDVEILYNNFQNPHVITTLPMYNYFKEKNNLYYCGKSEYIIQHYKNDKGVYRFIYNENGEQKEIQKRGAGYSKYPEGIAKFE
jgi:hypothetical protein